MFREIVGSLFATAFPTQCSLCAQELTEFDLTGICPKCWGGLEPWLGPACARCGLPLSSAFVLDSTVTLCGQCRRGEHHFDFARSYGLYSDHLRAAVLLLKFRRRERLAGRLGELLASVWEVVQESSAVDPILAPVPLHPSRERERGFNQATLLAHGLRRRLARISKASAPRIETRCLRRTRPTAPQTGLSLRARLENVRGVFEVASPERIRGLDVVLVDDVMTTGATVSACAGALKRAGARRVLALTLARATPQFPDDARAPSGLPVDEPRRDRT